MKGNPQRASEIGDRIYRERYARGLTQRELAKAAGLNAMHISHLEAGRKMPSVDTLLKVAKALGVTLDSLASGGDKETNDNTKRT